MITILEQQVKGALENKLFNSVISLNSGINNSTVRAIVSRVAEVEARSIVDSVFKTGNQQVNTIPQQLIGLNNPVDLVSSNFGSTGIFNNISPVIETQLTAQLTNSVVSRLLTELRGVLPANSNIINFDALAGTLIDTFTPTITSVIGTSFKGFTDGLFNKGQTVNPVGGALNSLTNIFTSFLSGGTGGFTPAGLTQSLQQIDLNFSNNITNTTLNSARNFKIDNPENQQKLEVSKKGFNDPSATYPKKEYQNEPETNKLARGEITGTIVQKKNEERMIGAKLPFNNSFSEPLSPFKGEYPFNKITETESGHVIEIDDTPGCERLHVYHKSGTYIEIDANGSVVKRTKGSSYEIIDVNGKIAIRGKADISINGACNIFVGNDANMEVLGNVNVLCHNDITAQAGGKLNLSAKEEINIHSGNVNIEADQTMNILADKVMYVMSGNAIHMTANTEILTVAKEDLNIVSAKNVKVQSSEDTHILAAGNFNADGQNAYINSGNAVGANVANIASTSNIGLITGRIEPDQVELIDPEPLRIDSLFSEKLEGYNPTPEELKEQKNEIVTRGIAKRAELDDTNPVVISESTPKSTQGTILTPDVRLLNVTSLPGNYNLSPNFTLDSMWKTVAVSPGKHNIKAQAGLTYGQIVYNLQAVALNILEPVLALYPNMYITSAFRHESKNPNSPHPAGLAVDLQFKGVSRKDYYDIAVKLAQVLTYDQVLLEYYAQAKNPWIHIGLGPQGVFNNDSLRKVAWTFKDHKLFKQNLVYLA